MARANVGRGARAKLTSLLCCFAPIGIVLFFVSRCHRDEVRERRRKTYWVCH
jgi:hypothetical protein